YSTRKHGGSAVGLRAVKRTLKEMRYTLTGRRIRELREHIDQRLSIIEGALGAAELGTGAPKGPPRADASPLARYVHEIDRVEGWLHQYSAKFIADLSREQSRMGIVGSLGEICIHHGKLFLVLRLSAQPNERCF